MAPPPTKRQRRQIVLSSDVHNDSTNPKPKSTRSTSTKSSLPTLSVSRQSLSRTKVAQDPANSRSATSRHAPALEDVKPLRPISAFFNTVGQHAKHAAAGPSSTAGARGHNNEEEEDNIEDVSDIDGNDDGKGMQDTTQVILDCRKEAAASDGSSLDARIPNKSPNGSQNFKHLNNEITNKNPHKGNDIDQRPWADKFGPSTMEELAIHKKKVFDVRTWLENVLCGRDFRRLLVLKGPAGAGKTATLKILAEVMELDVSEWKNPIGSDFSSEGYTSMSAHFEDFLCRSGKFNELALEAIPTKTIPISVFGTQPQDKCDNKRIVLLEEFPNTFISASAALQSFRSSILQHLSAGSPTDRAGITPVVMIITETRLTSTLSASDSFTVHRLLGSEILSHPAVAVIEFNPVAPTFIRKALELVIQKEARRSGRRRVPGPSVLQKLCEKGDIRSAVGSLEFLCIRNRDGEDWGGRVAANSKRGAHTVTPLTTMERNSVELVTQRENSLGLFHAIGKVVYNKRDDYDMTDPTKGPLIQPPDHLRENARFRISQISVDRLIDDMGTDTETFVAALYENYVMSCEGSGFLDSLDSCLGALSDGDLLGSSRSGRYRGGGALGPYGAASEALRQDEIAFQVVVKGLLFALPDPVKRSQHPTGVPGRWGGKGDSHKMFYPVCMRLSRQMEEVEHTLSQWSQHLRNTTIRGSQLTDDCSPILKSINPGRLRADAPEGMVVAQANEQYKLFWSNLQFTNVELMLEMLPYIAKIRRADVAYSHLQGLESLTQFRGIYVPNDDLSEEEDAQPMLPVSAWENEIIAATKPKPMTVIQERPVKAKKVTLMGGFPIGEDVKRLYLTDDDIED